MMSNAELHAVEQVNEPFCAFSSFDDAANLTLSIMPKNGWPMAHIAALSEPGMQVAQALGRRMEAPVTRAHVEPIYAPVVTDEDESGILGAVAIDGSTVWNPNQCERYELADSACIAARETSLKNLHERCEEEPDVVNEPTRSLILVDLCLCEQSLSRVAATYYLRQSPLHLVLCAPLALLSVVRGLRPWYNAIYCRILQAQAPLDPELYFEGT